LIRQLRKLRQELIKTGRAGCSKKIIAPGARIKNVLTMLTSYGKFIKVVSIVAHNLQESREISPRGKGLSSVNMDDT